MGRLKGEQRSRQAECEQLQGVKVLPFEFRWGNCGYDFVGFD
jgi:hypothetical protein